MSSIFLTLLLAGVQHGKVVQEISTMSFFCLLVHWWFCEIVNEGTFTSLLRTTSAYNFNTRGVIGGTTFLDLAFTLCKFVEVDKESMSIVTSHRDVVFNNTYWLATRTWWRQHSISRDSRDCGFTETSTASVFERSVRWTLWSFVFHGDGSNSEGLYLANTWNLLGWDAFWTTSSWVLDCVITLKITIVEFY